MIRTNIDLKLVAYAEGDGGQWERPAKQDELVDFYAIEIKINTEFNISKERDEWRSHASSTAETAWCCFTDRELAEEMFKALVYAQEHHRIMDNCHTVKPDYENKSWVTHSGGDTTTIYKCLPDGVETNCTVSGVHYWTKIHTYTN